MHQKEKWFIDTETSAQVGKMLAMDPGKLALVNSGGDTLCVKVF